MHLELQSSKSEKRVCQAHGLVKSIQKNCMLSNLFQPIAGDFCFTLKKRSKGGVLKFYKKFGQTQLFINSLCKFKILVALCATA